LLSTDETKTQHNRSKHSPVTQDAITQIKHKKLKPGLVTSYNCQPGNRVGHIHAGPEWTWGKGKWRHMN